MLFHPTCTHLYYLHDVHRVNDEILPLLPYWMNRANFQEFLLPLPRLIILQSLYNTTWPGLEFFETCIYLKPIDFFKNMFFENLNLPLSSWIAKINIPTMGFFFPDFSSGLNGAQNVIILINWKMVKKIQNHEFFI